MKNELPVGDPIKTLCLSNNKLFTQPIYRGQEIDFHREHVIDCIDVTAARNLIRNIRRKRAWFKKNPEYSAPTVLLLDISPSSGIKRNRLVDFVQYCPCDINIGVLSDEGSEKLIYECYRLGAQCFIDIEKADIESIFRSAASICSGNGLVPRGADHMMRNVIRAISSGELFRLNDIALKLLHLVVEGYTVDAIRNSLALSASEYGEVVGDISQFSGGSDLPSLYRCAIANGMISDNEIPDGVCFN